MNYVKSNYSSTLRDLPAEERVIKVYLNIDENKFDIKDNEENVIAQLRDHYNIKNEKWRFFILKSGGGKIQISLI
jgi:hypothetical protein